MNYMYLFDVNRVFDDIDSSSHPKVKTTTTLKVQNFLISCNRFIYLPPPPNCLIEEKNTENESFITLSEDEDSHEENNESCPPEIVENLGSTEYLFLDSEEEGKINMESLRESAKVIENVNKIFGEKIGNELLLFPKDEKNNKFIQGQLNKKVINKKRKRDKNIPNDRKYREYMVRRKIARDFINQSLIDIINKELKNSDSKKKLKKFSKKSINEIAKKCNIKILKMNLEQIFISKEFDKKITSNDRLNLKMITELNSDECREDTNLGKILNMNFSDLFTEYLSSEEYIKNVNKVKSDKKFNEYYLQQYINFSRIYIQNYQNSKSKKGTKRPKFLVK